MQICYTCHHFHDDRKEVCNFCSSASLIDAEIPEEHLQECNHEGNYDTGE